MVNIIYLHIDGLSSRFFHHHHLPVSPDLLSRSRPDIVHPAAVRPRQAVPGRRRRIPALQSKIVIAIIPESGTVTGKNPIPTSIAHQGAENERD
jgi:hypothetical protein